MGRPEDTGRAQLTAGSSSTEAAKETSRLETFADGVFAIAITLLVLEIHVPEGGEDLGAAILAQWPSFAAYVISFSPSV